MTPEQAAALRAPFPTSAIGKLPRAGTQLDYVGHAAVTSRLLEVDPEWSWEPVAYAPDGAPLIVYGQNDAHLWIRLMVAGVERIGVGTCRRDAFELPKQLISDAIRNAAMRFGVALDLWSKEEIGEAPASNGGEHPAREGSSKAPVRRQPEFIQQEGVVAASGTHEPDVSAGLSARARALPSRVVSEARREAGLRTIKESDAAGLVRWAELLTKLEAG
jgi:hypothetical protein